METKLIEAPRMVRETAKRSPFIEANTSEVTLSHLNEDCIIPVFSKDNEVCISHQAFIENVYDAVKDFYKGETVGKPAIRVSHIIKGRTPEAIHKPVSELTDSDRTMYYERMIFNIEIPTVHRDISGNSLCLSVCGCKSHGRDNLSGKLSAQKFSLAVGFINQVCTNQCLTTDGFMEEIRCTHSEDLYKGALNLFRHYNADRHIQMMQSLGNVSMSEHQFCQILGRMRLYNYLNSNQQRNLPKLLITDSQINNVARQYLQDENFAGTDKGISMWKFYNLLTGANKNSYLDMFLTRSLNATEVSYGLSQALQGKDMAYEWFIK
ncbi:MAG: hypothetical protein BGN96_15760 [Bacteroidales bacterium 45-6]|nr:MAG: hypothetical protein BGN96_15760 [Bacteroidales bacterium 45-6]